MIDSSQSTPFQNNPAGFGLRELTVDFVLTFMYNNSFRKRKVPIYIFGFLSKAIETEFGRENKAHSNKMRRLTLDLSSGSIQFMKSTSQAAIILFLVMIIIVLTSLFWFLYSDYDETRQQADLANSRATRAASMEAEAGQLRVEADQILTTRDALEMALATAVFTQDTQEQESINDQQTIQSLETRVAEQTPDDSIPEISIIAPQDGSTFNLTDLVELVVAAIDPSGINTIKIVFDNNPPLEIPAGGETSVIIQESWPFSEAGDHTAVITAVNRNNISSQATTVTITTQDKRTSQQIMDEVANIIGSPNEQTTISNESQQSADNNNQVNETDLILQAFDFDAENSKESVTWGSYCEPVSGKTLSTKETEVVDSPATELALVQATVHNWQESQYQLSQQVTQASDDDKRAALCALAAGHERWVMEEYIRRAPAEQQATLLENLTPQTGLDTSDILTAQQSFGTTYGPAFFNAITAASGETAVIDAWNRPPQTSYHILYPAEYAANTATQAVSLPDLSIYLGDEWTPVTTNVLGAFMLGQYLGDYVEPNEVETAVSGWQGDQFAIYQQQDGSLLLIQQINWASDVDAQEFLTAYEKNVNGRFAGTAAPQKSPENSICWADATEETICIFTNETQTLIVKAPENNLAVDTLEEVVDMLGEITGN
jgi:hypothetical protein